MFHVNPLLSIIERYTVELQWLEHLWDYENLYEAGVVWATEGLLQSQVRRHYRDIFSIFFNMKVYCVFTLESPQRGDSNEYKTIYYSQYKQKQWDFFQGTQERVRNSRRKRAISVRAIEVLLYIGKRLMWLSVCFQGLHSNFYMEPAIAAMHVPHSLVQFGDKVRFGPIR